jgi:hypothetical protein
MSWRFPEADSRHGGASAPTTSAISQGSSCTLCRALATCCACCFARLASVETATGLWACNIVEHGDVCRPDNRAASSRACFLGTTIKNKRERVQTFSRRRRTKIGRAIQVCTVWARLWPPRGRAGDGAKGGDASAAQLRGRAIFAKDVRCAIPASASRCSANVVEMDSATT